MTTTPHQPPSSARLGLTARLLWLGLLPLVLILIVIGTLLYGSLRLSLHSALAQNLHEKADGIQAGLSLTPENRWQYEGRSNDAFGQIFSGWYWVLQAPGQTAQPQQTLYSRSLWDASLGAPGTTHADMLTQTDPRGRALLGIARHISLSDDAGQLHEAQLQVYTLAEPVQQSLARIQRIFVLALVFLLFFLIANTLMQVRVGLRPLQQLQQALARMNGKSENPEAPQRLGLGHGKELDPLAREIDTLLEHNTRLLARGRTHAADLSHALKTPLSRLSAQASAQESLPSALVLEQVQSIHGLIERHMSRTSHASDSAPSLRQHIALAPTVQALLQLMQHIHAARALDWQLVQAPDMEQWHWRGEQSDLEEMLGNVLDNAGKWARSQVRIAISRKEGRTAIQPERQENREKNRQESRENSREKNQISRGNDPEKGQGKSREKSREKGLMEMTRPEVLEKGQEIDPAHPPGAMLCIDVHDDGPGIAHEHLPLAAQRGQRFDERTPGTGLGLHITAEIAHSWGGQLTLQPSATLGGLHVRLMLPLGG